MCTVIKIIRSIIILKKKKNVKTDTHHLYEPKSATAKKKEFYQTNQEDSTVSISIHI